MSYTVAEAIDLEISRFVVWVVLSVVWLWMRGQVSVGTDELDAEDSASKQRLIGVLQL